jgi:hypothetical protein
MAAKLALVVLLVLPLLSRAGCPVDTDVMVKTSEELEHYLSAWNSSAAECTGNLSVTFQEAGKYSLTKGYGLGGSIILDGSKQEKGSVIIVGPPVDDNFMLSGATITAFNIVFLSGDGGTSLSPWASFPHADSSVDPHPFGDLDSLSFVKIYVNPSCSTSFGLVPVAAFTSAVLYSRSDVVLKACRVEGFRTTGEHGT